MPSWRASARSRNPFPQPRTSVRGTRAGRCVARTCENQSQSALPVAVRFKWACNAAEGTQNGEPG